MLYARGLDQSKDRRIIVQMVTPPGIRTSPPTSWWDCSVLGLHCQLRWVVASKAGDCSTFVFFVHKSPAKLGTPLVVKFCYVFAWLQVQCAIKLLHVVRIKVLILGSTSGALISISQTFFYPATRLLWHLSAGSRTTWIHII
jgi:hypothetical protein